MATPELQALVNELVQEELKRRNLGADDDTVATVSSSTDAFYCESYLFLALTSHVT